jgi:uncharacterized coiled-coil DUF342 family protein
VPGRFHLSEEDERVEAEARDRLRQDQHRLRELGDRRGQLLQQVRQLSDEQHALHDQIAPDRERVEAAHDEYRDAGRRLAELRKARDALRPRLEMALTQLKARSDPPARRGGIPLRPDQIRQELAHLEMRQQTQALSLADENALIDRLRELRRLLTDAEKSEGARAALAQDRQAKELQFRELRAEFERLGEEYGRLRAEREGRMASMRQQLAEVGQKISLIRERARLRGQLLDKVEEVNRQMASVDREIRQTLLATRARTLEARRTISEFTRRGGRARGEGEAVAQVADEQFQQLMKHGKVTLGG